MLLPVVVPLLEKMQADPVIKSAFGRFAVAENMILLGSDEVYFARCAEALAKWNAYLVRCYNGLTGEYVCLDAYLVFGTEAAKNSFFETFKG